MPRPEGQLDRSLARLTLGVSQGRERRQRITADGAGGEYDQPVHVRLAGTAGSAWGFTDVTVNWEMPFLYAPLQRKVPFLTPHFIPGVEFTEDGGQLILFHAAVVGWLISKERWYTGAVVRFGFNAPAGGAVPYSAIAHLTFQGYASYAEGDEFT